MESRFKIRISHLFRSSFTSCRPRNLSDVVNRPQPQPQPQPVFMADNCLEFEPLSPKVELFPSICKPKAESRVVKGNEFLLRRKVSDRGMYFVSGEKEKEGRTCPPASPISPLSSLCKLHEMEIKKKKLKKTKNPHHHKHQNKKMERCSWSSSSEETNNNGWFSSEDETEDETEKFFSSKSFSSDSSSSRHHKRSARRRRDKKKKKKSSKMSFCPLVTEDMVEESVAVVKRSKDPHSDFRTSMVEMIIERQIFSTKDLEKLLQCFLSLNSPHHHRIIVEVFTEIWEALFSSID